MVAELLLVLGLLVSSSCEVRGRDPDVEDAQKEGRRLRGHQLGATAAPLPAALGSFRSRTWCGLVGDRLLTSAAHCRTERCTARTACPGRQRIMSAVSRCPRHQQQQLIFLWCCCGGIALEHLELAGSHQVSPLPGPGLDLSQEQSDQHTGHAPYHLRATPSHAFAPVSYSGGTAEPDQVPYQTPAEDPGPSAQPYTGEQERIHLYSEFPAPLPVPHMMALVMSQLQPLLQSFNASLVQLGQQVAVLTHEVAHLKSHRGSGEMDRREAPPEKDGGLQDLEAKLDQALLLVTEVQRQVEQQRPQVEVQLRTQHGLMLNNLSSFQRDVDLQLQLHRESLQEGMDAVNATLVQVQNDPVQGQLQKQVSRLLGSVDSLDGEVRQLRQDTTTLDLLINQTARTGQVKFMLTGLEVEAAKVAVLQRVAMLGGNLSMQDQRLQEVETDMDYLFQTVARLQTGQANLTEQVQQNRVALDEEKERSTWPANESGDWEPAVEELQRSVQQVKMTAVSEQARTKRVEAGLTRLGDTQAQLQVDLGGQKEEQQKVKEVLTRLSGTFTSLMQDVIRHNDVLELLLGEEVLEFLEWALLDQEAHSIPAIKEQLQLLQVQLSQRSHGELQGDDPGLSPKLTWARERRRSSEPAAGADGGDLWRLERQVEALERRLRLLEEEGGSCCGRQLPELRRELQDLVGVLEDTFRNVDPAARPDLLRVWARNRRVEERRSEEEV